MRKSKSTATKPVDPSGLSFNEVFDSPETPSHGGRSIVVMYRNRRAVGAEIHESIDAATFDRPNVLTPGDALELAAAYTRAAHEVLFGIAPTVWPNAE